MMAISGVTESVGKLKEKRLLSKIPKYKVSGNYINSNYKIDDIIFRYCHICRPTLFGMVTWVVVR